MLQFRQQSKNCLPRELETRSWTKKCGVGTKVRQRPARVDSGLLTWGERGGSGWEGRTIKSGWWHMGGGSKRERSGEGKVLAVDQRRVAGSAVGADQ